MAVYERATQAVQPSEQYDMYNIYIKRAAEIYGVTHTRSIYEKAIEVCFFTNRVEYQCLWSHHQIRLPIRMQGIFSVLNNWIQYPLGYHVSSSSDHHYPLSSCSLLLQVLSDEHAREMCQRFADMECKLGEIDRARAIYSYCSQICDPRVSYLSDTLPRGLIWWTILSWAFF